MEEVFLIVAVHVRILAELFRSKLKKYKVNVYDYDQKRIDSIELSKVASLLVHNKYILIRGRYVIDLFSDQKFMSDRIQTGQRIDIEEYFSRVREVLNELTLADLIALLCKKTDLLSASSNMKDIIFMMQNLYTLGGLVVGEERQFDSGPLETILNRTVANPRYYLEPDLRRKLIRIEMRANGDHERHVMPYKDFYREISKAYGDTKLRSSSEA